MHLDLGHAVALAGLAAPPFTLNEAAGVIAAGEPSGTRE
jgi:hypothetical protein